MIKKHIREGIVTSITCLKNCRALVKFQAQRNHDEAFNLLNHINLFNLNVDVMNNLHTSQSSA